MARAKKKIRKAARARRRAPLGLASAIAMRKRYGARALRVAFGLKHLAKTGAARTHWGKVVRALEGTRSSSSSRKRRRNPAAPSGLAFRVHEGQGAAIAAFRSMPRAREFAQALADRTRRAVRVTRG